MIDIKKLVARARLNLSLNKRLSFGIVIVLGVALAIAWLSITNPLHIGQKIYAEAAGHKIYEPEIKSLMSKNQRVNNHEAATVLANKYLTEAMAKQDEISVSDQEVKNAYGPDVEAQKSSEKFYYQTKINLLYFTKLESYNKGIYKGKYLIVNFGRYVPYNSPLLAEDEAANPNLGNPNAIAQDKKYAGDLINKLRTEIAANKITFDQAIKIEQNDPIVGKVVYPTVAHSGSFDTSLGYDTVLSTGSPKQQFEAVKQGQLSQPFVARVSNSATTNSTAEMYYVVVRMDTVLGGNKGLTFEQYLAKSKQKLGYKINV